MPDEKEENHLYVHNYVSMLRQSDDTLGARRFIVSPIIAVYLTGFLARLSAIQLPEYHNGNGYIYETFMIIKVLLNCFLNRSSTMQL